MMMIRTASAISMNRAKTSKPRMTCTTFCRVVASRRPLVFTYSVFGICNFGNSSPLLPDPSI